MVRQGTPIIFYVFSLKVRHILKWFKLYTKNAV